MKDNKCEVFSYQIEYKRIDLKLKKENKELYKKIVIIIILKELNKRFIAIKINKATKKGTKIKYKRIDLVKNLDIEKRLKEIANQLEIKLKMR